MVGARGHDPLYPLNSALVIIVATAAEKATISLLMICLFVCLFVCKQDHSNCCIEQFACKLVGGSWMRNS